VCINRERRRGGDVGLKLCLFSSASPLQAGLLGCLEVLHPAEHDLIDKWRGGSVRAARRPVGLQYAPFRGGEQQEVGAAAGGGHGYLLDGGRPSVCEARGCVSVLG